MSHERYMRRAIQIAKLGGRRTKTNPNVGAVIVHNGKIIGEGYHEYYGGPHAEPNAIHSVKEEDRHLLPSSSMYVTLEPCNVHGKTPPCSELIVRHKIKNLFIGCFDPSDHLSGKSAAWLRSEGINVESHLLEKECLEVILPFKRHLLERRPYVVVKLAKSKDNFMGKEGQQVWISNAQAKIYAHHLRDRVDGILIGSNTAETDNPSLTTREIDGDSPLRIVLDRRLRLSKDLKLYTDTHPCITITQSKEEHRYLKEVIQIEEWTEINILEALFNRGIYHLLIEGGSQWIKSLIHENLWDEAHIIESDKKLEEGIKAPNFTGEKKNIYHLGNNKVSVLTNPV